MTNEIKIYYWPPSRLNGKHGHIALKINNEAYISYWPNGDKRNLLEYPAGIKGGFLNLDDDKIYLKGQLLEIDISSLNLSSEKMLIEFFRLRNLRHKSKWHLLAEFIPSISNDFYIENCSSMVMRILIKGGFHSYLPLQNQQGGLIHYFYLISSSNFISSSIFVPGLYPLIDQYRGRHSHHQYLVFLTAIVAILLNGTTTELLEKYFIKTRALEKQLTDDITIFATSVGFSLPFLFQRHYVSIKLENQPVCMKLPVDFGFLSASILTAFLTAFVSNIVVYFLLKSGHIKSPKNIYDLIKNILNTNQSIDARTKQALFKKNCARLLIMLLGYISIGILTKIGIQHEKVFFLGITAGVFLSYALIWLCFIRSWDEIINREIKINNNETKNFIATHNQNLFHFTLMNTLALVGMFFCVRLTLQYTSLPSTLLLLLSCIGTFISYLLGVIFTNWLKQIKTYITNRFLDQTNYLELNHERMILDAGCNVFWPLMVITAIAAWYGMYRFENHDCADHPIIKLLGSLEAAALAACSTYIIDSQLGISNHVYSFFSQSRPRITQEFQYHNQLTV